MSDTPRSSTDTLIRATRILAHDIRTDDGVANAALFEAAGRLEELQKQNDEMLMALKQIVLLVKSLPNEIFLTYDVLSQFLDVLNLIDKAEGRGSHEAP
jgi:hypothetical protein